MTNFLNFSVFLHISASTYLFLILPTTLSNFKCFLQLLNGFLETRQDNITVCTDCIPIISQLKNQNQREKKRENKKKKEVRICNFDCIQKLSYFNCALRFLPLTIIIAVISASCVYINRMKYAITQNTKLFEQILLLTIEK